MESIYRFINSKNNYNAEQEECIKNTVHGFELNKNNEPVLLFGEIQSGKTRTFIGIMAESFDKGYEVCVILTKNTIALAEQTYKRLDKDFQELIDDNEITLYDVMQIPNNVPGAVLNKKILIVVKKQKHNIKKLLDFYTKNERLRNKKLLIIDDEADFTSIGFKKDDSEIDGVSVNVIMSLVDKIRQVLSVECTFLQVTATPYCLYLQPKGHNSINKSIYYPMRPEITSIVPTHDKYIGGHYYFEESENSESPASYLFVEIPSKELKKITTKKGIDFEKNQEELKTFKLSILNYLVATAIRTIQESNKKYKSSFLIHIDQKILNQNLQSLFVFEYINFIKEEINSSQLISQIKNSFESLNESIILAKGQEVKFEDIYNLVRDFLIKEEISITTVNSENQVRYLLDRNGQLGLKTKLNIFIGGNVLDRGITIESMLGFYYGRNPNIFQQDTVLQHSRMYGARNKKDLSVSRFYTSARIYIAMKQMYEFDSELRQSFIKGINNDGVIFVNTDSSKNIRPCAPNKILISNTSTIKPNKRLLPMGFDSKPKSFAENSYLEIIEILKNNGGVINQDSIIKLSFNDFSFLIVAINRTLDFSKDPDYKWDVNTFLSIAKQVSNGDEIVCLLKWNRNISRKKNKELVFQNAPDDGKTDLPEARKLAIENTVLILTHQKGLKENGWSGNYNFFWPVLLTPKNTMTAIYTKDD
jgi:Z1 domain/Type III restriction enzyme, res subunit